MAFDPTAKHDVFQIVEGLPGAALAPGKVESAAEQIAELRARAIERSKANTGDWGFGHSQSYFESLAGEQSSEFDFGTLRTVSKMLMLPGLFWRSQVGTHWDWVEGRYNRKTGCWLSEDQKVSIGIEDFRKAVDERIASLGLSAVMVYAWALSAHSHEDSTAFWRQSLENRIEQFRRVQ
jgi:hypothetical protein